VIRGTPFPVTVTLHVPRRKAWRAEGDAAAVRRRALAADRRQAGQGAGPRTQWKRLLESGEFATIGELAEREGIAPSCMTRVLRLTLLAPNIVEAILDGRQRPGATRRINRTVAATLNTTIKIVVKRNLTLYGFPHRPSREIQRFC
jgi:hypothetical protein